MNICIWIAFFQIVFSIDRTPYEPDKHYQEEANGS